MAGVGAGVVYFVFEEYAGEFVGDVAGWVDGVCWGEGDVGWESAGLEGELEGAWWLWVLVLFSCFGKGVGECDGG